MKFVSIGRPHQYMHELKLVQRENGLSASGRPIKSIDAETDVILRKAIIALANQRERYIWSQNSHPISHTIVSYDPSPVKLAEKDVLVDEKGNRYQIQGIDDPAGVGQFAIYYVLKRKDTND